MKTVEVKLCNSDKLVFTYIDGEVEIGNYVVLDIDKTLNLGKVIALDIDKKKIKNQEKEIKFVRKSTKEDIKTNLDNIKEANSAFRKCTKLIEKYKLDMRLIDAFYTLDKKQLVFQFTSDNRVDFRDLAKELASIYRTRIELRQIGVRDKAKCVGGIGVCGKELCCSQFLHEMDAVSINMAKNQKLALNPSKINGTCGRLLCCLKYEDKQYCELKKGLPEVGATVNTEFGDGVVTVVNICNRTYKVDVPKHGIVEITLEEK